jgi:hypothetical protein
MDMSKTPAHGAQRAHAFEPHPPAHTQECIQACLRTYQTCLETMQYCLQQGGPHVDPHHLKLMQTCAEIARSTSALMMLQSPHFSVLCALCATVCRECAKSCEEFAGNEVMSACAQICLSCAERCDELSRPLA